MKIGLGTARFGMEYGVTNQQGLLTQKAIDDILRVAHQAKIDIVDTAIAYGQAEAYLGASEFRYFKYVTKIPRLPEDIEDAYQWIKSEVNKSLHRLNVQSLYGLLLHRSQDLYGGSASLVKRALQQLKDEGVVRKVGVSIYSPSELEQIGLDSGLDLVQAPLNLVDRRLATSGWLDLLRERGVEVHVRSVFLQGILLASRSDRPPAFSRWENLWKVWQDWQQDHEDISPMEACLGYVQSVPGIEAAIVGVETKDQLLDLIKASERSISAPWPEVSSIDPDLVNPSRWNYL